MLVKSNMESVFQDEHGSNHSLGPEPDREILLRVICWGEQRM